ncbi:hypothetical protein N7486_005930 [Penicillium sp. IBT 16267x]|nr:hypothetical protein N7486_005930 [Penicillium sp. IBT 16267x]
METVKVLLQEGKIPVISFTEEGGLTVLPHDSRPYIAISHVCVEGMGSTCERGLPECQIKFIKDSAVLADSYIKAESVDGYESGIIIPDDSVPFWIDSLCVPGQRDLRRKAISLMAHTYASATAVVAVNGALLNMSISMPLEQQLFTLYFSKWVRKLWILQEAMLSRKLFLCLSDAIVDVLSLFEMENRLHIPVFHELYRWVKKLLGVPVARSKGEQQKLPLVNLVLHLAHRSSSKPEDEILAIAGLLGLDVSEYISLDPDERMVKFLMEHNQMKVWSGILFLEGPKMLIEGFAWAPRTFMTRILSDTALRNVYDGECVISDEGLVAKDYYCVRLDKEWEERCSPRNYRVTINDGTGGVVAIQFDHHIDPDEGEDSGYDALLLQAPVQVGQERFAAAGKVLEFKEIQDGIDLLRFHLNCYVRVYNGKERAFHQLSVGNSVKQYKGFVLII